MELYAVVSHTSNKTVVQNPIAIFNDYTIAREHADKVEKGVREDGGYENDKFIVVKMKLNDDSNVFVI